MLTELHDKQAASPYNRTASHMCIALCAAMLLSSSHTKAVLCTSAGFYIYLQCSCPDVMSQQPADSEAVPISAAMKQSQPKLTSAEGGAFAEVYI